MPAAPAVVNGRPVGVLPEVLDEVRRGTPMRVTEVGEAILARPCRAVGRPDRARWAPVVDDMFATMWVAEGVGLAANQVDLDVQLFVYDLLGADGTRHVGHVFDPVVEVMGAFGGLDEDLEGCLSVPGPHVPLARPAWVRLRGLDLDARPVAVEARDYLARCLQHEVQHLQGTLYVDLLDPATRHRTIERSRRQRESVLAAREARAARRPRPAG
ncbi:peptide deformylase [Jannaschia sp. R86511]|uniref:peptide deformylase n=1 Tax=Jannaschia sp. R86511 TaxID=3093853 RepID=UPI0036D3FA10